MLNSILDFIAYHTPIFYLTQSVWRDEAFSFFMARRSVFKIILASANDFNPPLYYLLLHFWMYLAGHSDEALRFLSFLFHITGSYYAYLLGRKLSGKRQAFFLFLFYLINPMLLYFAFEMRMYSLYAALSMAAIYYFYTKDWKKYLVSAVLGLYSHSYFVLLIVSLAFYNFVKRKSRKILLKTLLPIVFFLPWVPIMAIQFVKSKESWLYPVDWHLIRSVLGNLFVAYEGTPGNLWQFTFYLSLVILSFMIFSLKNGRLKPGIFIMPIILPLTAILGYSVIKRPLYVHRYLIFISVFEVLAVFLGVLSIKKRKLRRLVNLSWILFLIIFNIYITPFRKKTDFKSTFREINKIAEKNDFVYTKTPIAFLESAYYFQNSDKTFVYNPKETHIPNYIGVNLVFPEASQKAFPPAPSKTYLVDDKAGYEIIYMQ